jgi:DNA-binding response OmpR family regulator
MPTLQATFDRTTAKVQYRGVERPPTPTILVVEDEPSMRQLLLRLLTRAGFDVRVSATVQAALPHVLDVDLMVLDYRLPDGTGADVVRAALVQRGVDAPPAILLTGTPEDVVAHERHLFAEIRTKPCRLGEVRDLARALLANRRPRTKSGVEVAVGHDASEGVEREDHG